MTKKSFLLFRSPRTLVLVLVLAVFIGFSFANTSTSLAFICYAVETTDKYYSDATHTTLVGKCVENECKFTYSCWGQQTDFVVTTTRGILCRQCDPACCASCSPCP